MLVSQGITQSVRPLRGSVFQDENPTDLYPPPLGFFAQIQEYFVVNDKTVNWPIEMGFGASEIKN
jgi:hypothetical protein